MTIHILPVRHRTHRDAAQAHAESNRRTIAINMARSSIEFARSSIEFARKTPGARNDLAKLLADKMQEMLLETTALAGLTPEQALAATAKAVATPSAALAAANSNGAA